MYGVHMNELQETCTQVWATNDLQSKKNLLRRAIKDFKYKAKIQSFETAINEADANECDKIAGNLILNKTDKVVGLLKR